MARTKFTPGRYESGTGTRIRGKVTKATKGKLSTLGSLRYGPEGKPKKAPVKKTEQYTLTQGKVDPTKQRKVLTHKGSVRAYAQMTLGKYVKQGKFEGVPTFGGYEDAFKTSVLAMAEEVKAPEWMMRKLDLMNASKLYMLSEVEGHTIEVYFDYGGVQEISEVDDNDLFWSEKWDDVMFLIEQYERAFGVID